MKYSIYWSLLFIASLSVAPSSAHARPHEDVTFKMESGAGVTIDTAYQEKPGSEKALDCLEKVASRGGISRATLGGIKRIDIADTNWASRQQKVAVGMDWFGKGRVVTLRVSPNVTCEEVEGLLASALGQTKTRLKEKAEIEASRLTPEQKELADLKVKYAELQNRLDTRGALPQGVSASNTTTPAPTEDPTRLPERPSGSGGSVPAISAPGISEETKSILSEIGAGDPAFKTALDNETAAQTNREAQDYWARMQKARTDALAAARSGNDAGAKQNALVLKELIAQVEAKGWKVETTGINTHPGAAGGDGSHDAEIGEKFKETGLYVDKDRPAPEDAELKHTGAERRVATAAKAVDDAPANQLQAKKQQFVQVLKTALADTLARNKAKDAQGSVDRIVAYANGRTDLVSLDKDDALGIKFTATDSHGNPVSAPDGSAGSATTGSTGHFVPLKNNTLFRKNDFASTGDQKEVSAYWDESVSKGIVGVHPKVELVEKYSEGDVRKTEIDKRLEENRTSPEKLETARTDAYAAWKKQYETFKRASIALAAEDDNEDEQHHYLSPKWSKMASYEDAALNYYKAKVDYLGAKLDAGGDNANEYNLAVADLETKIKQVNDQRKKRFQYQAYFSNHGWWQRKGRWRPDAWGGYERPNAAEDFKNKDPIYRLPFSEPSELSKDEP